MPVKDIITSLAGMIYVSESIFFLPESFEPKSGAFLAFQKEVCAIYRGDQRVAYTSGQSVF